jgi:hypothetical protein
MNQKSSKQKSDIVPLLVVGSLTWLAFALRLRRLGAHSLWYDELLELDIVQGPFMDIGHKLIGHAAMPLDYVLLHGWITLGRQDSWVRFPALLFGVMAIPLMYVLASRLINKSAGYSAAFLLTISAFAVRYSQEARPYALLLFLVMITFLGFWQVYRTHRRRYWVMAVVGMVGAALTHYFAIFLLLPLGLFVAIQQLYHLKPGRFSLHTSLFALLVVILGLVYTLNGRLGHLYSVGERFTREVGQLDTYTIPAPDKPNRGTGPPLALEFFREKVLVPLTTVDAEVLLLYGAFFLAAVVTLGRPQAQYRAAILFLLSWLILPTLLIYTFLLHRGTFFATRYILYTLPPFLILVAYGIDTLTRRVLKLAAGQNAVDVFRRLGTYSSGRLLPSGLIALFLAPLFGAQLSQLVAAYNADSREDWRAVAQLLHDNAKPGDGVVAVWAEPTINWYYPDATTPFGTYRRSEAIWKTIREKKRRWFVLSSYSFKRDQGLRDWLERQQAVKLVIDRRVVVYFHHEGQSAGEMLAQVKSFTLPQKGRTYRSLADQFRQQGDFETSRTLLQMAEELDGTFAQDSTYLAQLARLVALK